MSFDLSGVPVDPEASAALAEQGLEYRLVDAHDRPALEAWIQADVRGFHHPRPRPVSVEYDVGVMSERRVHGVYDSTAADPSIPIATVSSWPCGLSVPGGRSVDGWAVSSVTVSPTHRRRGIARALMEGELANARSAGAAVAMLTVTEATIYGRYGYAPAASSATVEVDRTRARWAAPDGPGRVQFVDPQSLREVASAISRRAVARTPGEIDRWPGVLDRMLGLVDPESDASRSLRTVRYDDEQGQPQGFAAYRITREPNQPGWLEFDVLAAATDDAERALWQFLVGVDFVSGVRGLLRSVDEPLPWLLEDRRAVTMRDVVDHLWIRIIDPVAALSARRYGTAGELVLEIDDPMGYAAGRYTLLSAADGRAHVHGPGDGPEADAAAPRGRERERERSRPRATETRGLRLGVEELAAIYLGGVRPSVLARASRITETSRGSLELADRMFASDRAPQLSIWF